ncbi:MAG: ABC transporter ATP-binding protein [Gemmatimonadaceae bacterium]
MPEGRPSGAVRAAGGHYRRLLPFLRPYLGRVLLTVGASFAAAALDGFSFTLLIPFLRTLFEDAPLAGAGTGIERMLASVVGPFVDAADPMGSLKRLVGLILLSVLLKNVFAWFAGQNGARLLEDVTRDLRNTLYAHLARLPLGWYVRTKAGQVLARVLTDTQSTKALITNVVTQSLQSGAMVVVYVVAMLGTSWRLTLVSLVAAPLLIGGLQPLLKKLRRRHRGLGDQYGEMTSLVQETVAGARLVKSFGGEAYEEARFRQASDRYARGMVRVTRLALLTQPITEVAGTGIAVLVLFVGARQVLVEHTLDGGALIVFLVFVTRLLQPLKQLSQMRTTSQAAAAAADRLFEVMDQPTEDRLDRGTAEPRGLERGVELRDVWFSYGGEPVLRGVSLTARRGELVALVGPSGSGKSTLVDLIPRFNEPTRGQVLVDGVDAREMRLRSLRALVGIVSQDTVLFNDTVRANVAYGAPGRYTDAQIEAAARAANAHGFIAELPQGYDTALGERGARLSGGQRQRLAIARALLVNPPILILDEATSALDTESERLVQEALDRLLAGRTVFVIAHRLSTVAHADQILVLDRGTVVERGTHAELLVRGGAYARLHLLQFRDDAGRPEPGGARVAEEAVGREP